MNKEEIYFRFVKWRETGGQRITWKQWEIEMR